MQKIIALPTPRIALKRISNTAEVEKVERRDEIVQVSIPYLNILSLPQMSAILPNGSTRDAADKKYEVVTHPSRTASAANSLPIEGSARVREAVAKGERKEPSETTNKADFLALSFSSLM